MKPANVASSKMLVAGARWILWTYTVETNKKIRAHTRVSVLWLYPSQLGSNPTGAPAASSANAAAPAVANIAFPLQLTIASAVPLRCSFRKSDFTTLLVYMASTGSVQKCVEVVAAEEARIGVASPLGCFTGLLLDQGTRHQMANEGVNSTKASSPDTSKLLLQASIRVRSYGKTHTI